jgi:hypothetical protein
MTPWFEDAAPGVVAGCRRAVEALRAAGARVIESLPEEPSVLVQ